MKFSRYRVTAQIRPDGRVALVGGQGKDKLLAESEAFTPPNTGRTESELVALAEVARAEAAETLRYASQSNATSVIRRRKPGVSPVKRKDGSG